MTPVERILGLIGQKCFDSYVYFCTRNNQYKAKTGESF